MTSLRLQERIRTGIITGLLVLGLLFVGLLSHQTYVAFSSQQTLVQDILRDYATLAADDIDAMSCDHKLGAAGSR